MKPNQGFVKLYRSLMDHPVFVHPEQLKVFIWCLLKARFAPGQTVWHTGRGRVRVSLDRGSFLTTKRQAAMELQLSASMVYRAWRELELMQCISLNTTQHYTRIKVLHFDSYQDVQDTNTVEEPAPAYLLETIDSNGLLDPLKRKYQLHNQWHRVRRDYAKRLEYQVMIRTPEALLTDLEKFVQEEWS